MPAAASALADPTPHARGRATPGQGAAARLAKQAWRKGDRLPLRELDGDWIDDDGRIGLDAPPRGHRWVRRDDGRDLLVALATGMIVDMLLR